MEEISEIKRHWKMFPGFKLIQAAEIVKAGYDLLDDLAMVLEDMESVLKDCHDGSSRREDILQGLVSIENVMAEFPEQLKSFSEISVQLIYQKDLLPLWKVERDQLMKKIKKIRKDHT